MQIMDADPKPRIRANAQIATSTRRCKIFNVDSKDSRNIRGYAFIRLFQFAYMVEVSRFIEERRSSRCIFSRIFPASLIIDFTSLFIYVRDYHFYCNSDDERHSCHEKRIQFIHNRKSLTC